MNYLGETPTLLQPLEISSQKLCGWSAKSQLIYFEASGNLFALDLTSGQQTPLTNFEAKTAREFCVSPNEEWLAFTDSVGGPRHVLIKPLRSGTPTPITFGEGTDYSPVWFPDNRQLAFSSDRNGRIQLYLGATDGRTPEQLLFTDDNQTYLSVSPNGRQLISSGERDSANLIAVDLQTGQETSHSTEFGLQLYPELSPDGRQLVYQATNANINLNEAIMLKPNDPASQPLQLTAPGFHAKWSPNGEALAFIRYAAGKAELRKVSVSGRTEKLLASGLRFGGQTALPYYRTATAYHWSPNGASLVYHSVKSGSDNLWTVTQDGTADKQLTGFTEPQLRLDSPVWSPDGKRIAFLAAASVNKIRKQSLFVTAEGRSEELFSTEHFLNLLGWSASGQELFLALTEATNLSVPATITLLRVPPGHKTPVSITQIPAVYFYSLTLADDGQRVAAVSRATGQDNLVTVQLNGGALKRVTNNSDATIYYSGLTWAPDGKALYLSKQTAWLWMSLIENFQ